MDKIIGPCGYRRTLDQSGITNSNNLLVKMGMRMKGDHTLTFIDFQKGKTRSNKFGWLVDQQVEVYWHRHQTRRDASSLLPSSSAKNAKYQPHLTLRELPLDSRSLEVSQFTQCEFYQKHGFRRRRILVFVRLRH